MMRYCPHCWHEAAGEPERCPHCGQLLDDSDQPFVDRLMGALRHPEPTRVGLAIDVLTRGLHEPRAVPPLIALLDEAHDPALLVQAARGLGELGDRRATLALARLLADPERPYVARRAAAATLGRLGGPEARRALLVAVDDPCPTVAEAAREALQRLGA